MLVTKRLEQNVTDICIHNLSNKKVHLSEKGDVRSYKNHDAINVSFKRLSELFRTSGKEGVKKGKNRIDLTDSSFPPKVLPWIMDHAFFFPSFLFFYL